MIENNIPYYKGLKLTINPIICNFKYVQKRKHKKKRINKKWLKRYGYDKIELPACYQIGNEFICNETFYHDIIKKGLII